MNNKLLHFISQLNLAFKIIITSAFGTFVLNYFVQYCPYRSVSIFRDKNKSAIRIALLINCFSH